MTDRLRIPLSVPHLNGEELPALASALASNWVASVGPDVDAFEGEFASLHGVSSALATTSGTSALHLALRVLDIGPGDEVLVSTLTFCASVNPILYQGATPVFIDSEERSWNMDPGLLEEELDRRGKESRLPAAVVVVHLYGQTADMNAIVNCCERWGVPLVEDAAESLGAFHRGANGSLRKPGAIGTLGFFSFDGAKMITTSIGGMLLSSRPDLITRARKLARQAREPVPHYEHTEIGYNYRLSNVLAAIGRAQLRSLPQRVEARRAVFAKYARVLGGVEGIRLQPEAGWGIHARWLTCLQIDPGLTGTDRQSVHATLMSRGIESRPVWKPMHQQPVYRQSGFRAVGGAVSDRLFAHGLCLPSSSSLTSAEIEEVATTVLGACAPRE